jgi:hypothetical protein
MKRFILWVVVTVLIVGALYYSRLRKIPGVSITSWWRSPWRNYELGGSPLSLHQIGLAWDLVPASAFTQAEIIKTGLPLKLVNEGDHIHAQFI